MSKSLNAVLGVARERISGGYSAGRNMGAQQSTSLGKDPAVDYAPKAEDERKFVAAHTHIEQEYPTGMKDVFQGNAAKRSMDTPQMSHYGRKSNADAEAAAFTVQKEDVEQVDEMWKASQNEKGEHILKHKSGKVSSKSYASKGEAIDAAVRKNKASGAFKEAIELMDDEDLELYEVSKGLADRYSRKASRSGNHHKTATTTNDPKKFKKSMNRLHGVDTAEKKIAGKAKVNATEEVELDEISRNLASKYVSKAKEDGSGKRRAGVELALRKKYGNADLGVKEPKVKATGKQTRFEEVQVTDKTNTKPTGPVKGPAAVGAVQPGTSITEPLKNDKEKNKAKGVGNHAVKEDLVTEISKALAGRYITRAHAKGSEARSKADAADKASWTAKGPDKGHHVKRAEKFDRKDDKRTAGIHRAVGKLTGTAKVNASEEFDFDEIEFTDELLEAGILCDKKSLGKKMKYHKAKIKNEEIGSMKYKHHLNQSNIIKKMMEGMEAVELDEKKQDDNFEYKKDKRGFIIKKRGYKKTEDKKKKSVKEDIDPTVARIANHITTERF